MNDFRVIVVGLGVQGHKRRRFAGSDCVATVDPDNEDADFKNLSDVPLGDFDAALCCIPDGPKAEVLTYLLDNGKHVLVEKPLWAAQDADIATLEKTARRYWRKAVIRRARPGCCIRST